MRATLTSRYSFTGQYVLGAKYFADQAGVIEAESVFDPARQIQHRAYVAAAIMQSTAALESEASQIVAYGPGQHLGSNETDIEAQKFLSPLADEIDSNPVIRRYEMILHLLGKEPIDRGQVIYERASLLVRLRNALVHYESVPGPEMDRQKLYQSLKNLRHKKPSFIQGNHNFFPHECLSAECAGWAWTSAVTFLDEFSEKLGKPCVLDGYRDQLS